MAVAVALPFSGASGGWLSYLASVLAVLYGLSSAARFGSFPRIGRGDSWMVIVDLALISLLVADTGGAGSPFSILYLLAAFGTVGRAWIVPSAVIAVAGYLAALAVPTGSLSPILSGVSALYALLIALAFYMAGKARVELLEVRKESGEGAEALAAEEEYSERLDSALSHFGSPLGLLRPEDVLQRAVETAWDASWGAAYIHAALPEGNLHRTVARDDLESCPSWWHPEVQRLVLWSARSGETLRESANLPGVDGFLAVPIALDEGPSMGTLLVGGDPTDAGTERILHRIALETARALADRERAPGGRDPISGLPNRASLVRVLQQEQRYEGRLTLLHAGLDGFERYCKIHGLSAGENLLYRIGERLDGGQHRVFHAGVDEFALLVGGGNEDRAYRVALGIREAITELITDYAVPLTAYVGIAPVGGPGGESWTSAGALYEARHALEGARRRPEGIAHTTEISSEPEDTETLGTVEAMVEATQAHDAYLGEHLRSVSRIARELGRQLGLSGQRLEDLTTGALLHDVGKIGLSQSLLRKPGSLDAAEYEEIKSHPEIGVRILEPVRELSHALPVVNYHHERYDGHGYPSGLRGEKIPLEARITLVADALDSMIRDRVYRKGLSQEDALREITAGSGSQFDPEVVQALLSLIDSGNHNLRIAN